jgi:hypothetical protein
LAFPGYPLQWYSLVIRDHLEESAVREFKSAQENRMAIPERVETVDQAFMFQWTLNTEAYQVKVLVGFRKQPLDKSQPVLSGSGLETVCRHRDTSRGKCIIFAGTS